MIVSRRIDTYVAPRSVRVPKAVEYKTGGDDPVFMQPFQKAHFNVSRGIRKPYPKGPAAPRTNAPLMVLQEGSDLKSGLYTPQAVGIPLKVPKFIPRAIDPMMEADEVSTDFQAPINYNLGIRPEPRNLLISKVSEPAPAMFRPGRAPEKMQFEMPAVQYRDKFSQQLAEMLRQ